MTDDLLDLGRINDEIAQRENAGDAAYFERLLAPAFAMRRAKPTDQYADRAALVAAVRPTLEGPTPDRRTTDVEVLLELERCAVVTCVVHMTVKGVEKSFHNSRVFVRDQPGGRWWLLSWANQEV